MVKQNEGNNNNRKAVAQVPLGKKGKFDTQEKERVAKDNNKKRTS